jgi:hypothetical protein
MRDRDWCVMRQDDNGNRYVVAIELTEPEAQLLSVSYAARGHKQLYWAEPMTLAEPAPEDAEPRRSPTVITQRSATITRPWAAVGEPLDLEPRAAAVARSSRTSERRTSITEPRAAVHEPGANRP